MIKLIDDIDHLDAQDNQNWTAFHHAIRLKKDYLFEKLAKSYTGKINEQSISALDLAALMGNKHAITSIINEMNFKEFQSKEKTRFFNCLCINGNIELIDYVIEEGLINLESYVDIKTGKNILHYAVLTKIDISYLLEKYEISHLVNKGDKNNRTPLHIAAKYSSPEVCEILIKNNASVHLNDSTNNENTPIHYACSSDNNTLSVLLENISNNDEIFHVEASKTKYKTTPLHIAAKSNCTENFKLLLDKLGDKLNLNNLDSNQVGTIYILIFMKYTILRNRLHFVV